MNFELRMFILKERGRVSFIFMFYFFSLDFFGRSDI